MPNVPFSPEVLALTAAFLFGAGSALSKPGLRHVSPRTGGSISLPATAVMFWMLAPFWLSLEGFSWNALLLFAVIGAFFPAAVTILNFEATRRMGATISSAVTATSGAFAVLAAILFLGESITFLRLVGTAVIVVGIMVMSLNAKASPRTWARWMLLIPLAGAAIRGNSQTLMKYGLTLWSNPFAASLVAYTVSAVVIWVSSRFQNDDDARFDARAVPWLLAVGLCNGSGLLLSYLALQNGPVSVVAPIVTTGPLFTFVLSWLFLREERFDWRLIGGVVLTVAGVVLILVR